MTECSLSYTTLDKNMENLRTWEYRSEIRLLAWLLNVHKF